MGHRSSLQNFHTKHGVMCNAIAECIKGIHSNKNNFNLLKGYSFHQLNLYVNENRYSEHVGRVDGFKVHSQGTQVGSAVGRGAVAAAKVIVPMGVKMGIAAGVKAAKIYTEASPQNIPINIPSITLGGILPAGVTIALAPIGAAIGPWIGAAQIMHKFRTVNNMSLLDLHDFYPDGNAAYCTNSCPKATSRDLGWGMGKSDRNWKTCEDSCWYFADRSDFLVAKKAAMLFLGVATLGLLPVAVAIGSFSVEKRLKVKFEYKDKKHYLTPHNAKWEPDQDTCSFPDCQTGPLGSRLNIFAGNTKKTSRHHCRLCGKVYCGEHCKIKVPMIAPLENGHEQRGTSRFVNGKYKSIRNTKEHNIPIPGQLICTSCLVDIKETSEMDIKGYMDEKTLNAQNLIDCALKHQCPRAQAALLVAFRGNHLDAIKAMFANDGATVLADKILG